MSDNLAILLQNYRKEMLRIFDKHLARIVLYGSYARGDFNQESDMDIMILADIPQEEVSYYADLVYDVTYDFEMQYGIEINPSIQSNQLYNQWKNVYPFFKNIEKDGVGV